MLNFRRNNYSWVNYTELQLKVLNCSGSLSSSRGDFCFHRALDDTNLKFGILTIDALSRKFPSGRKRLHPSAPLRGVSLPRNIFWVYSWFNDGILLDIMKDLTTKISSPSPLRRWDMIENVFFLCKIRGRVLLSQFSWNLYKWWTTWRYTFGNFFRIFEFAEQR